MYWSVYSASKFNDVGDIKDVVAMLAAAGPGSRGIVFGMRNSGIGHVFNAANQHGVIRFLDGQTGKAAEISPYIKFQFLRTW